MADNKKPKRLNPKRPDRELYIPRHRKATTKNVELNQRKTKCDSISDRSHDLPPNSQREKRPFQVVDCDIDPVVTNVCIDSAVSGGEEKSLGLPSASESFENSIEVRRREIGKQGSAFEKVEPGLNDCVSTALNDAGTLIGSECINDDCIGNDLSYLKATESDCFRDSMESQPKTECGSSNGFEVQDSDPPTTEGISSRALKSHTNRANCDISPSGVQDVTETDASGFDDAKGVENSSISKEQTDSKELTSLVDGSEKCKAFKSHRKIKIHRKEGKINRTSEKAEKVDENTMNNSLNDRDDCAGDDDWFDKWDETGNCVSKEAKDELAKLTAIDIPIILEARKPDIDYLSFRPVEHDLQNNDFRHLTEVYDFSPDLTTSDLSLALQAMGLKDFDIKWVDDTHAIGVFSTEFQAQQAIKGSSLLLKIRPVTEGTRETQLKVKSFKDLLLPYKSRPETTAVVARNLVSSALGIRKTTTKEQRDAERKKLAAAKERKVQKRKEAAEVWGE